MPIEVNELIVRANINEGDTKEKQQNEEEKDCNCQKNNKQAVAEQIMETFSRKKER